MAYSITITRNQPGQWDEASAAVAGGGQAVVWQGRAEYVDDPVYLARYATGDSTATQSETALVATSRVVNGIVFLPRAGVHEQVHIGDRVRIESPTGARIEATVEGLQRTGFQVLVSTDTTQFLPA